LDCLAAQTRKDFEVVLVDNGSTDGSLNEVESR
jgi:glycosyltransferase involved in cell wall biosynthesis